jgi:hypothetical protein
MNIKGQQFEVEENHLAFELHDPYWSAFKKFGWPFGTEGYSINHLTIEKASDLGKKIKIKTKYGDYEITPSKAIKEGRGIHARNGTVLVCIPKYALTRISGKPTLDELRNKQATVISRSSIE